MGLMLKRVTKEKVVPYEEDELSCDLCDKVISKDSAFITLYPKYHQTDSSVWRPNDANLRMDVCSTTCLVANAGAAGLVFDTKILPETRNTHKADKNKWKETSDNADAYKQMTKTISYPYQQLYTTATDNSIKWTNTATNISKSTSTNSTSTGSDLDNI